MRTLSVIMMFAAVCAVCAAPEGPGVCKGSSVRIVDGITTPGEETSLSQLATPLLGGKAGQFWGSINSTHASEVCDALLTLGPDMLMDAILTAYGSKALHSVRMSKIRGCTLPRNASPASPAGVELLVKDEDTSREYAVLCGNWIPKYGLDYTEFVDACDIYLLGPDIEEKYQAALSNSTRKLLQNGCQGSCVENCVCSQNNVQNNCFPSDATVVVEGAGTITMDKLRTGQKVLSADAQGRPVFTEVSFFGHKDADSSATVVALEVQSEEAGAAVRTLRLTDRHYLPVVTPGGLLQKYAREVSIGDKLMLVAGAGSEPAVGVVVGKELEQAKGLFNPYTKNGFLVVDGVLASAHSEFLLDDLTPASLRHLLPALYQVVFAPVFLACSIAGPRVTDAVTDWLVPLVNSNFLPIQLSLLSSVAVGVVLASRTKAKAA